MEIVCKALKKMAGRWWGFAVTQLLLKIKRWKRRGMITATHTHIPKPVHTRIKHTQTNNNNNKRLAAGN